MSTFNCCCIACVNSSEAGIIEDLGKFSRPAPAGLHCLKFPCESLVSTISLRTRMMNVRCETKTADNVFCTVELAIMYKVVPEKVSDAFYRLRDPQTQIRAFVFDVVRGTLPKLELDAAFVSKNDIADACETQLKEKMTNFGYSIVNVLVTDLEPDARVKSSMNDINAASRLRIAAGEKAEGDKILAVKSAEADADSKYLSGQGVARQRKAVVDGLRASVSSFAEEVPGATSSDVLDLLLVTQYFDMLKEVGEHSKVSSMFIDHTPTAVADLRANLRKKMMPGLMAASASASASK